MSDSDRELVASIKRVVEYVERVMQENARLRARDWCHRLIHASRGFVVHDSAELMKRIAEALADGRVSITPGADEIPVLLWLDTLPELARFMESIRSDGVASFANVHGAAASWFRDRGGEPIKPRSIGAAASRARREELDRYRLAAVRHPPVC